MYQVLNGMIDIGDGEYEGGEFVFPVSKCSIKTNTGDAVFFPANYMGSHGVSKVTSGQRYSYLTQFGQGVAPGGEISEATESRGWLPPVYLPWIFQDYERFFKSGHSKSGKTWMQYHGGDDYSEGSHDAINVANPVSQQRSLEGDAAGVYQPYRD